jgi:hypothetical protein
MTTVDPSDGLTFWHVNEYYTTLSSFNWHTRIGSFKFGTCGSGGIPCADLVSFQVRCKPGGKLQAKLTLTSTAHSGEMVTITVDGTPHTVTINGNKATLQLNNSATGVHTVTLTDPAGCFPPSMPTCN